MKQRRWNFLCYLLFLLTQKCLYWKMYKNAHRIFLNWHGEMWCHYWSKNFKPLQLHYIRIQAAEMVEYANVVQCKVSVLFCKKVKCVCGKYRVCSKRLNVKMKICTKFIHENRPFLLVCADYLDKSHLHDHCVLEPVCTPPHTLVQTGKTQWMGQFSL